MTTPIPPAWLDLLEALTLLAQHPTSDISPLYCTHDTLRVCADDSAFTPDDLARLAELGFNVDSEGGFWSTRFGSA